MRINKFFTENGFCSRREADRIIQAGRVRINDSIAKLGDQVSDIDKVYLDGKLLTVPEKRPVILAYNKPRGIECTSDPAVEENIINAVNFPERIFHIGRLDKFSEGLILLTNIGDLVNKILRSRYEHEKEYVVVVADDVSDATLEKMSQGLDIGDDRPTKACKIIRLGNNKIKMILTEGRNRQIRRMVEAINNRVVKLKRVRVMNIELGEMPVGQWRYLTEEEYQELSKTLES